MLKENIEDDLKEAMKQKAELKISVLRMFLSALKNKSIEKRGKTGSDGLSEEEVMAVMRSEVKKRRDSIQEFGKGGRQDLVNKEAEELKILEVYLPAEISDIDLEVAVRKIIENLGAISIKEFGKVMGLVMKDTKGRASGDRASKMVNKLLLR